MSNKKVAIAGHDLYQQITGLIEQSQKHIAIQANSTLTLLFWKIGRLINENVLANKRADYAKRIVSTLSAQLKSQYGKNFEERNVRRMMQFAEQFTNEQIVVPLARQLSWSHFVELLPLKTQEAKLFYANLASAETNKEQVELLEMHKDGIMVAEYWTAMPPKKELEQKLHQLVREARERIERKKLA